MNKGSSGLETKLDLIKFNTKETEADIIFVTEANDKFIDGSNNANIKKVFKGFNVEESKQLNSDKSRCILFVKKKIKYKRVEVDISENPIIVIKFKSKKDKLCTLVCH